MPVSVFGHAFMEPSPPEDVVKEWSDRIVHAALGGSISNELADALTAVLTDEYIDLTFEAIVRDKDLTIEQRRANFRRIYQALIRDGAREMKKLIDKPVTT